MYLYPPKKTSKLKYWRHGFNGIDGRDGSDGNDGSDGSDRSDRDIDAHIAHRVWYLLIINQKLKLNKNYIITKTLKLVMLILMF